MDDRVGVWRATAGFYRSVVVGAAFALAAVLFGRPELLVMSIPFLVFAGAAALGRPTAPPRTSVSVPTTHVSEGQAFAVPIVVQPPAGMEHVSVGVRRDFWFSCDPAPGIIESDCAAGTDVEASITMTPTRWGLREISAAYVMGVDAWGAFVIQQHHRLETRILTVPQTDAVLSSVPALAASGLIGANRSGRPGQGSEFAGIRAFRAGDRMKDIHWPPSLRSRELQVVAHWSEQDGQMILVVDAAADLGVSGGIDGAASSLDTTVRAACAIAEFYLHRGDRVGVRIVGQGPWGNTVDIGTGKAHYRRISDRLAQIETTLNRRGRTDDRAQGIPAGTLVLMLSPMAGAGALAQAATYQRRGARVVVIDTLPTLHLEAGDLEQNLHWRVRALERARQIAQLTHEGLPIVPWEGPRTLGTLERVIGHLDSAARVVRR